ncbi:hypothetical protein QR46_1314 [Giardia duodenalis assemblage B]|uniref:Uncharacterized protein n=3 Tax=Giardia intestinalis TaxID=5741 RepID=A0A132NX54_GIAIN|nr:Hypothetical protein GSB_10341 [Giardia intestinalis]KWX14650.1 hypothetical protein QR46_1314 [Giardia intestinalis assemblage B]
MTEVLPDLINWNMFTRERIEKAAEIAVTHGYKNTQDPTQKRKDLFDEALTTHRVYLVVILHNIPPEPSEIPRPIVVTHPIFPLTSTLSGVVEKKDAELVKANTIFNKLITIEEIRDVHLTFQMRRDLAKAYDVYACTTSLYDQVLKYGGKSFTCKHTIVCTDSPMEAVSKEEVMCTTQLRDPKGNNLSIKVGYFNATDPDEEVQRGHIAKIADNVLDVIKSFDKTLPGGFKNCKLLAINLVPGHGLPNIPFYESVLPKNERIFEEHPIRPPDPLDTAIRELYRDMEEQGMIDEEMKALEPRMSRRERERAGLPRIRASKAKQEQSADADKDVDKYAPEKSEGSTSSDEEDSS